MKARKKKLRKSSKKSGNSFCLKCLHSSNKLCLLGLLPKSSQCEFYQFTSPQSNIAPYQLKQSQIKTIRENIAKSQRYICPICGRKMNDDIVLDHHHKKRIKGTGLIRGAVCRTCNVFIAKSENNAVRYRISNESLPDVLRRVAEYLEKKQYPYLHPSEKQKQPLLKKASYNKLKKIHTEHSKRMIGNSKISKIPDYPKSGKLTKPLKILFKFHKIEPEFYKK